MTKCGLSGGPNQGTIYVNWTDQRNGADDTDVWLVKSVDGGNTWSDPIRINDDEPGSHQFFSWMDIDQTNGNLFFVFYDRRTYSDNRTDVYMAYSLDGGDTFTNKLISESPFIPSPGVFFGDYTNIQAHNNIVRPIWTRLFDGTLSVWTDVTPFEVTTGITEPDVDSQVDELNQFPNPASGLFYISFKLHKSSLVDLKLYDANGREVVALFEHKQLGFGKHIFPVDPQELHLESGIYYPRLFVNGTVKTLKTIVVE
ncbi:MAG: T9SS C-terminal target domain-containing protein [Bacteroidetes bacterium]|nr:MAG: T9SS C-terminal target domain-containing protein [Bacteroidota bacterium]